MKKRLISSKQALAAATLILLIVCMLTFVTSKNVYAQDQDQQTSATITLTPSEALPGTTVILSGEGFSTIQATQISFNGKNVGSDQAGGWNGEIYLTFTVPNVSDGSYTVTANDGVGDSASAQFVVGQPLATATPVGQATPTPYTGIGGTPTYTPYYTLPPTQSSGSGVSLLLVALIAVIVAIAVIIPFTFFMMRGRPSKRDRLLERQPAPYTPQPTAPYSQPTSPYNQPPPRSPTSASYSSPYNRPTSQYNSSSTSRSYSQSSSYRPSMYDRYSQRPATQPSSRYTPSSSTGQSSNYGKTCPHCHRTVRSDYNICPYCNKRL